jgi:hypothetical protein
VKGEPDFLTVDDVLIGERRLTKDGLARVLRDLTGT